LFLVRSRYLAVPAELAFLLAGFGRHQVAGKGVGPFPLPTGIAPQSFGGAFVAFLLGHRFILSGR